MKKYLILFAALVVGLFLFAFRAELAPKRAAVPDYKYYGPTSMTNSATVYHTLESYVGDDLWFTDASTITAQIKFDELTGSATTDATLQGTNQLDAASPTWVDVWSPASWTADEDTLISITPVYALYRIQYVQTGTATSTVRTDWIVE